MTKTRECGDKKSYPTKRDAITASIGRRRRFGALRSQVNAYHCNHCGSWHIGHTP